MGRTEESQKSLGQWWQERRTTEVYRTVEAGEKSHRSL